MKTPQSFLILSITFSIVLFLIRVFISSSLFYLFLIWNLFLAIIPYLITSSLSKNDWILQKKLLFSVIFLAWLLFLPNAPYIITDFLHFKKGSVMPQWFDILLLTSFSLNGFIFGLASMLQMEKNLSYFLNIKSIKITMFFICILCGFGIYLGRYLRYNTWDLLTNPLSIMNDIYVRVIDPLDHLKTWGITLGFGFFLWILYGILTEFLKTKINQITPETVDSF